MKIYSLKYILVFIIGILFPLFSLLFISGFSLYDIDFYKFHKVNPLLYVIDTAPLVLLILVYVLDYYFDKKTKQYIFTKLLHEKIVANSFDAIVVANSKGIITYLNESTCKMFGYDKKELLRKNLSILMPEKHISAHEKGMQNHINYGVTNVIGKGVALLEGKKKDGSIFPIHLNLGTFSYKSKSFFSGVISDVSLQEKSKLEQERLFKKISSLKEFYEKVLNTIPVDIAVFDKNHKYKFVNPSGIRNDELRRFIIGKDDFEYNKHLNRSLDSAHKRRDMFNTAKKSGNAVEWSDSIEIESGEIKTLLRRFFPVIDHNNEFEMAIGFGLDITEQLIMGEKIENLSRFPHENPNVVARFDYDLKPMYINESGKKYLGSYDLDQNQFFSSIKDSMLEAISTNLRIRRDVHFDKLIFDVEFVPMNDKKYINIYGVDVSVYRNKIKHQHSQLLELNSQLKESNETLEVKVEERTAEISRINEEIKSSITYSKRIQDALIAHQNLAKNVFAESFVFYKPKDIVGGDFYFTYKVDDNVIFGVADCTGHGVPGAMVSLLCMTFIESAINYFKLLRPRSILGKVNALLVENLVSENHTVSDGMDVAICTLDTKTSSLYFSGANSKVLFIGNEGSQIISGNPRPVGHWVDDYVNFEEKVIDVKSGDKLYLYSDGLPDQFGGEKGKKLKYSKFHSILESSSQLYADEQKEHIAQFTKDWMGDEDQLDDITVAGLTFN
jgi:PAS domain S-box-containing protein